MINFRPVIALIVVVIALFGVFNSLGPELLRDIRMRNEPFIPAVNATIEKSKCTTAWFIFAHCKVKYALSQTPRPTTTDLTYAFFGRPQDGSVRLLRAASDSTIVATDVERAHLTNRIAFFVFFVGWVVLVGCLALRRIQNA